MKTDKKTIKEVKHLLSNDSHSKHHLKIELTKNLLPHIFENETEFVITKEQIDKTLDLAIKNGINTFEPLFKEWFPEAFKEDEKELFNGWYKDDRYKKWIGYYEDGLIKYGVTHYGEWMNYSKNEISTDQNNRKATEQEVIEALTKEAVKRGFKEGVAVKYPWFSELNKQHYIYTPDFKEESILENERFLYLGCCVFCGGQWAEIIPTISKEQAEKELGKKII